MSPLAGLDILAFAVETSPGWRGPLHVPHRRTFAADGSTRLEQLGGGMPPSEGTAELMAEQGDTLSIMVTGGGPATAIALTLLSPAVGEMTVAADGEWARCVVSVLGLPESQHGH